MIYAIKYAALRGLLASNNNVLSVDTHTSDRAIRHLFEIDKFAIPHIIPTHVDICEARAIESGQPDLVEKGVIQRHWNNLLELAGEDYKNDEQFKSCIRAGIEEIRKDYLK